MQDDSLSTNPSPKKPKPTRSELRARRAALRSQPVTPQKPADDSMSVSGFFENTLTDGHDLLKALFLDLPVAAYHKGKQAFTDTEKFAGMFNPENVADFVGNLTEAVVEPYQKHGFKVLYYRPVTTALDALAIYSLGTKSLGLAAKVNGSVRGMEIAKMLEDAPRTLAGKGIDRIGKAVGLDLPTGREVKWLTREENARQAVRGIEDTNAARTATTLSEGDAALFDKFRKQGATIEEMAANPNVAKALEDWRELVDDWQGEYKKRGVLSDARAEEALIKKWADSLPGGVNKENMAAARAAYAERKLLAAQGKAVMPAWGPSKFEKVEGAYGSLDDFLDEMADAARQEKKGFVASLERYTGKKGSITDPAIYIPQAIKEFRQAERNFRIVERVIQNPDWVKAAGAGEHAVSDLIPSRGAFAKYFDDIKVRAQAQAVKGLTKEVGAAKAQELIETDAATRKRLAEATNLFVANPVIRRFLKSEFTRNTSGVVRLYQRLVGFFAKTATKWNPRWYTGNVIGDAFLGVLGGAEWRNARRLIQEGKVPIEAAARMGAVGGTTGIGGTIERAADFINQADDMTRVGLITREAKRRLSRTAISFEHSAESLESVLKSTENFSDVQVQLQLVEEAIARRSSTIQKIDRVGATLKKKEAALESRLSFHEERASSDYNTRLSRAQEARASYLKKLQDDIRKKEAEVASIRSRISEKERAVSGNVGIGRLNDKIDELTANKETIERLYKESVSKSKRAFSESDKEIIWRFSIVDKHFDIVNDLVQPSSHAVIGRSGKKIAKKLSVQSEDIKKSLVNVRSQLAEAKSQRDKAMRIKPSGEDRMELIDAQKSLEAAKRSAEADIAQNLGLYDDTIAEISGTKGVLTGDMLRQVQTQLDVVRQRLANLGETRGRTIRDLSDNFVKSGELEARIPGLKEQVAVMRQAVDYANSFVGEYLGLNSFERALVRNVFPFYAWGKAMSMLAFRLPFIAPVRTFAWHKFGAAMMSMYGDDEIPQYAKGYVPVFAMKNGDQVWLKLGSWFPASAAKPSEIGGYSIPSFVDPLANPFMRLIFSAKGGKTIFDTSHVPYGEQMVSMYNGDVYEYTGRGTVKKTIPQPPLESAVAHMFPVTQFVEDLITPLLGYRATDRSRIGIPRPVLNSDGSYRYPAEWWQTLTTLIGVPTTTGSREKMIINQRKKIAQIRGLLKSKWKTASPEERTFITAALNDWSKLRIED